MEIKVGTDVVLLRRFQALASEKTLERIFLASELKNLEPAHLGGIFAAKEAVMKALSIPAGEWQKIEVEYEKNGRPKVNIAQEISQKFNIKSYDLSISHDGEYAIATAIFLLE